MKIDPSDSKAETSSQPTFHRSIPEPWDAGASGLRLVADVEAAEEQRLGRLTLPPIPHA